MEKIKKLMIIVFIILILIIIIIAMLLNSIKKEKEQHSNFSNDEGDFATISEEIQPVTDDTMYYTVANCIQNYINTVILNIEYNSKIAEDEIAYLEEETGKKVITTEKEKANAIISILSKNYIEKNNITVNNIYNVITMKGEYIEADINKMVFKDGENIQVYGVYTTIQDIAVENAPKENKYFIVTLDKYNVTYSIEPIEDTKINDINDLNLDNGIDSIEKNDYNVCTYNRTSQQNMAQKYISDYKNTVLANTRNAYMLLDEEYRNKRFGSIEEYEKYVLDNKDNIRKISLDKYQVIEKDGYKEYICIDTNNKYYIFKVTAVMEYTLLLDTYTVDLPEFIEKYDKAKENKKVALNIEKLKEAIDCGDYNYVYSKLNETFRVNNFATLESFKNYIKTNYPSSYEIEYGKSGNYGSNYTQVITITDINTGNKVDMKTIVMKLKEDRDFEMSFDID